MKLMNLLRNDSALRRKALDAALLVSHSDNRGVAQVLADAKQIYAFLTGEVAWAN